MTSLMLLMLTIRLGRIYQAWGKYEEAIAQYEQSRELYQQLGKEANVANSVVLDSRLLP